MCSLSEQLEAADLAYGAYCGALRAATDVLTEVDALKGQYIVQTARIHECQAKLQVLSIHAADPLTSSHGSGNGNAEFTHTSHERSLSVRHDERIARPSSRKPSKIAEEHIESIESTLQSDHKIDEHTVSVIKNATIKDKKKTAEYLENKLIRMEQEVLHQCASPMSVDPMNSMNSGIENQSNNGYLERTGCVNVGVIEGLAGMPMTSPRHDVGKPGADMRVDMGAYMGTVSSPVCAYEGSPLCSPRNDDDNDDDDITGGSLRGSDQSGKVDRGGVLASTTSIPSITPTGTGSTPLPAASIATNPSPYDDTHGLHASSHTGKHTGKHTGIIGGDRGQISWHTPNKQPVGSARKSSVRMIELEAEVLQYKLEIQALQRRLEVHTSPQTEIQTQIHTQAHANRADDHIDDYDATHGSHLREPNASVNVHDSPPDEPSGKEWTVGASIPNHIRQIDPMERDSIDGSSSDAGEHGVKTDKMER